MDRLRASILSSRLFLPFSLQMPAPANQTHPHFALSSRKPLALALPFPIGCTLGVPRAGLKSAGEPTCVTCYPPFLFLAVRCGTGRVCVGRVEPGRGGEQPFFPPQARRTKDGRQMDMVSPAVVLTSRGTPRSPVAAAFLFLTIRHPACFGQLGLTHAVHVTCSQRGSSWSMTP